MYRTLLMGLGLFSICLTGNSQTRKLVWGDEFNYTGLPNPKKWGYDTGGHGWGNNELQYYTYQQPKNARVENGHLIIEAHKENLGKNPYTSARLVTKGKGDWTYGKLEIRAKIPDGLGTWPAIWMLASTTPLKWPDDGEIDIMEHVGYDQGVLHGTIHTKKYNHTIGTQKANVITVKDISQAFHVYQLEWDSETIKIGMDDQYYFTYKNEHSGKSAWPFDQPFHLLLNLAVGGNWGGAKGVDEKMFPKRMDIDWVRVYQ